MYIPQEINLQDITDITVAIMSFVNIIVVWYIFRSNRKDDFFNEYRKRVDTAIDIATEMNHAQGKHFKDLRNKLEIHIVMYFTPIHRDNTINLCNGGTNHDKLLKELMRISRSIP